MLLVAFLVTACGYRQANHAECQVAAPAQNSQINIISYPSPGMPFFGQQMTKCSDAPRLQVRHQMLPYEELVNQATISLSSGAASRYQLIHVSDNLLVEWASKGWLAPLDDLVQKYWTQYRLDEIPARVWDAVRVNEHIFSVPGLLNTENLVYRKDVLAKYGLSPPRTLDDLEKVCGELKARHVSNYPLVMMYSKSADHFPLEFHDLVHSMSGRWFNADGSASFADETGRAALSRMVTLYRSCMHPDTVNFTVEDAVIGLQQGQFVIGVMWMNSEPQLDDPKLSKFAGQFGFAPAPAACSQCAPAGAWAIDSWVIPANAGVDRDLVFRVLMEGLKTSNQKKAAQMTLVSRVAAVSANQDPRWAPGLESMDRGVVPLPPQPYSYLAVNAIQRFGMESLLGHLTVEEGLNQAAAQFTQAMREEGYSH